MRIDIITIFPDMLRGFFSQGMLPRAQQKGLLEIHLHQLRDYVEGKGSRKPVDDYAFGGGAGMVMGIGPIARCVETLEREVRFDHKIFVTPDGERLGQARLNSLSICGNLLILCGRYKGVDQRVRDHLMDLEISIGDYVLTGGELPAAVLVDGIARLIPGVLSDESSALLDSYQGGLLDAPVYTRPADYCGLSVPDVLLSGHEANIEAWRLAQSIEKTRQRRPDLLRGTDALSEER
ncbi:MAG: tRNA (guanosine(37)-N1)-methyltransferase TrmD [Bacteroidetes bacterium]|jgi:tRNA (guanine37-N1)-methyltransferase|nr:tRNA (guanosine(37)-N1)-methyltransferase TrmD [Bacteroidota bacterium]